jgi:hypothetical protein
MKKISTAAITAKKNFSQPKLTNGLDLGDRSSWYCLLDEVREVLEQKLATTPKAMREVFGSMPHQPGLKSLYHDVEIGLIPVANVLIKLTDMHVRVQEKTALEDEIAKLQEQRRILKSMIDMRDFETLRLRCLRLKVMKLKRMKVKRIKSKLKRLAMTVTQMA